MHRNFVRLLTVVAAVVVGTAIVVADPAPSAARNTAERFDLADGVDAGLESRTHHIAARIAYKDTLIRELVAGRATLEQVSEEFLRLSEDEPLYLKMLRTTYPGGGDAERSARNVLDYVAAHDFPAVEKARVLARLGGEFACRFGVRPGEPRDHRPVTDG